eukprot:4871786-Prymnesium_polylepis.1
MHTVHSRAERSDRSACTQITSKQHNAERARPPPPCAVAALAAAAAAVTPGEAAMERDEQDEQM